MNILTLGFPLRILGALLMISVALVAIDEVMMEAIDEMLNMLFGWIETQS